LAGTHEQLELPLFDFLLEDSEPGLLAHVQRLIDRFDMLGVGKEVPIATGNLSEGLLALVDGRFLTFRVPYPMGFYAKGLDGRVDDPKGGWQGKGIWTTYATRAPFHIEGGKGTTSKLLKFQVRPNPLAK